ncbi:hypothetical protein PUN28_014046 [Cardiocondyla obscurior]|uniref:Vacuolar ATP synthase subunit S1 n=2 Tax=Cardiocondyla obscurior TaxID=286306 RepID=A0AAW2F7D2_9HYME
MTSGTGRQRSSLAFILLTVVVVVCSLDLARACTPAVIWCPHESSDYDAAYKTAPSSPLQKLTSEEFENGLMQFNVTEPAIVTEELCIEDLRNNKVLSNATNGSKIFYFPCVDNPNTIFQKLYKQIRIVEDVNDEHELNMVLKDMDSNGCVALTGKQCRYSYTERIKRQVLESNSTEFKIKTDRVLLYSAKPLLLKTSEKSKEVQLTMSKIASIRDRKDKDEKSVILTISFRDVENVGPLTLEFLFESKSVGYYTLNKVQSPDLNPDLKPSTDFLTRRDITFPYNFSYHCSIKTVFANKQTDSYLSITDMQVQIDHKNATFNDAYDCVGFTSIPIWTGIFVTAILGLIMIWALTMIMDIRTMDRFDDPKGKTITISSAE